MTDRVEAQARIAAVEVSPRLQGVSTPLRVEAVMSRVRVDTGHIRDWGSFHRVFREVMGFPRGCGGDMDAWIECMSRVGELTRVTVEPEGFLGTVPNRTELAAFRLTFRDTRP